MEFAPESLSIHVLPAAGLGVPELLKAISRLQDAVVVHFTSSSSRGFVPFLPETLQACLAETPESLQMKTLPKTCFRKLMKDALDGAASRSQSLRGLLRGRHVADDPDAFRAFLQEGKDLVPYLRSYAMQIGSAGIDGLARKLKDALDQLETSAFHEADNVRCMDDLHYEILPVLKRLHKLF